MYKRLLFEDLPPHPLFNPQVTVVDPPCDIPNDLGELSPIDPIAKHELRFTGEIGVIYGATIVTDEATPFDFYMMRKRQRALNQRKKQARARTGRR